MQRYKPILQKIQRFCKLHEMRQLFCANVNANKKTSCKGNTYCCLSTNLDIPRRTYARTPINLRAVRK